ncbi:MAG: transglutaminase domain-containing protein [Planctomycetaceae bacterium]|jgi:transglutaminase-like putative cysteine protease|nr:transglutaminase domain-containing protein [Planctomycetaceae bacterium]
MKLFSLLLLGATCILFTGCIDAPRIDTTTNSTSRANADNTATPDISIGTNASSNTTVDTTAEKAATATKSRHFTFTYSGALTDLKPGSITSVWLPVATDTYEQTILNTQIDVPGEYRINRESRFGNHILYFQTTADDKGEVPFKVHYELERQEHLPTRTEEFNESQTELFISASRFVPTSANLLDQLIDREKLAKNSLHRGRQLYDAINTHMKYDKPVGGQWGRGDSEWACDSQHGNCTDFHSLFISICREQNIPARFEIGFPISVKRGKGEVNGYHCWAKFVANKQWIPVDISEANKAPSKADYYFGGLTENRITFTVGRDLELVPMQQAGPVNFLVYPYAEVDGKQHSLFRKGFKYSDL